MRLFEFRDLAETAAFVLAAECERATAIFQLYLLAHGGDPDSLMWRDRNVDDLDQAEQSAVTDAIEINREGLVICDTAGRWAFVTPVGDQADNQAEEQ